MHGHFGFIRVHFKRTAIQKLNIQSGSVALPDMGEVKAIDFIRFEASSNRYSESISVLATGYVNSEQESAADYARQAIGPASQEIVDDLEQFIRDSNCIYTIEPESAFIIESVFSNVRRGGLGPFEIAQEILSDEELEALEELPFEEYAARLDRIADEYLAEQEANGGGTSNRIAVASQCLTDVSIGNTVAIFKFDSLIAIAARD